jgi:UDP-GlcNAc:undecaprenyl-phosphate GlcNAc-1-phosphate transferase
LSPISYLSQFIFLLFFSLFLSIIFTFLSIKEKIIPNRFSNDIKNGLQKIHDGSIKRIGGLPLVLSLFLTLIFLKFFLNFELNNNIFNILLFSLIIFIIGFLEDLIKDIKPNIRLLMLSMITFLWLIYSKNLIQDTNIDFLDEILTIESFSIILSLITIISALNASNMMDGANGLLTIFGICVSVILICYAYKVNDTELIFFLITLVGSFIGFLIFNYPKGLIFLGDGGSYFIGAILATLLIYMSNNVNNFNMLNALIIMIYPIWELLFTICRRIYQSSKITHPDNLHLHTIINASLKKSDFIIKKKLNSNPLTAVIVNILAIIPSSLFLIYNFDKNLNDVESLCFFVSLLFLYTTIYLLLIKRNQKSF